MQGFEVSSRATSRAPTAPGTGQCLGALAQLDGRLPNGRFGPGNRFSQQHGRRSARAVLKRKRGAVARKLAATILARLGLLPAYRCRPRPLRDDQRRHLDREGLEVLRRLGII
jgi:hypothetical protein